MLVFFCSPDAVSCPPQKRARKGWRVAFRALLNLRNAPKVEPLDALRCMRDPDTGARFLAVGPLHFLCKAIKKRKQALGAGHNVAAERLCCDADGALEVESPVSSSNDSMSSVGEERCSHIT